MENFIPPQPPDVSKEFNVNFLHPEMETLPNGAPIYWIKENNQEVLKIEIVYRAGAIHAQKPLLSSTTNDLVGEGTLLHSSSEVTAHFDYFGSHIQKESARDYSMINLFSLTKFLPDIMDLYVEVLTESVFPQAEIDLNLHTRKARFESNSEKVDFICRNEFNYMLYGNHPYGTVTRAQHFEQLSQDDLIGFYRSRYIGAPYIIFVTGYFYEKEQELIRNTLGALHYNPVQESIPGTDFSSVIPRKEHIIHTGAIQTAIRMGKRTLTMDHEDYPALSLLNVIFGGYYGSRLMQNIRQDKGYTYGIHSSLSSPDLGGNMVISTEVGKEYAEATIQEIHNEIHALIEKQIPDAEFEMGKNFMLGSFMKSMDGAFAQSEKIRTVVVKGLPENYYQVLLNRVKALTPSDLHTCAQKYFAPDSFSLLTVGA